MHQLVPFTPHDLPALLAAAGERAHVRFIEFFTANIRNRNTRRAYAQAVREFLAWCEDHRVSSITAVHRTPSLTGSLLFPRSGCRGFKFPEGQWPSTLPQQ
jgi:hypothetical protein